MLVRANDNNPKNEKRSKAGMYSCLKKGEEPGTQYSQDI